MIGFSKTIENGARPRARDCAQRLQRMLSVAIRGRRFGEATAVVRNISPRGLGGTTRQWLAVGEEVELDLPNLGRIAVKIAWTDGMRFGAAFDCEIDPARVTRDAVAGMDTSFQVMDRYRPAPSAKRPPINGR